MKLKIGEKIKQLRRARDLTQEELAIVLGVSYQSVSRWENETCYPDMELLPQIATFFEVTVDQLLGTHEAEEKRRVDEYLSRFQVAVSRGDIDECIRIAREGVSEFPNNYTLLNKLMYALFLSGDEDGNIPEWRENMQKYDTEIISLGERLMKYCPEQEIRLEATARLAFHHCEMGRRAQGRVIYETLPSWENCKQNQIWWALEQDERLANCRERIRAGYDMITAGIYSLDAILSDEDMAWAYAKLFELRCWIYDGKKPPYSFPKTRCHYAARLATLGRTEQVMEQLDIAAQEALAFDARPDEWQCKSFLLGAQTSKRVDFETDDTRSCAIIMREKWLASPRFDAIRETDEFRQIIRKLQD